MTRPSKTNLNPDQLLAQCEAIVARADAAGRDVTDQELAEIEAHAATGVFVCRAARQC